MNLLRHLRRHLHAFTLIEVTVSVGIAAVGILTLVAMIPFGLESLRSSVRDASEAKMIQSIVADYQVADWVVGTKTLTPPNKEYYFAQQGVEVGKDTLDHLYTAQAMVVDESPSVPGDTSPNIYLRRLVIRIVGKDGRESRHETTMAFFDQTGVREVLP